MIDYWNNQAPRPTTNAARTALFELAANLTMDRCLFRPGVLRALFDPDFATTQEPFKAHQIPGVINAVDYDLGGQGTAYSDRDYKATSGSPGGGNTGGQYRNDGVDIERSTDPEGFDFNVGWIETREWLAYTVEVMTTGRYDLAIRVASLGGRGQIDVLFDGERMAENIVVPQTGGWQNWTTIEVHDLVLPAGTHELRMDFAPGGFNVNRMTFTLVEATGVEEEDNELPQRMRLLDVFPNPFQQEAQLRFENEGPVQARLEVFDVTGRTLFRSPWQGFAPGVNALSYRPQGAAGTYLFRLTLDDGRQQRTFTKTTIYHK